MDTELKYKYKESVNADIKGGQTTLDKRIFKSYIERYGTDVRTSVKYSLARRLWNCKLILEGDVDCKRFLNDLKEFFDNEEEEINLLHEWLTKQEIVEIRFECY